MRMNLTHSLKLCMHLGKQRSSVLGLESIERLRDTMIRAPRFSWAIYMNNNILNFRSLTEMNVFAIVKMSLSILRKNVH